MDWSAKFEVFFEVMSKKTWQDKLLKGLLNTVEIAVVGLIVGIIIGTIIAAIRVAPKYKLTVRILDKICSVYVAIFRGTPMVVQLLLAYYVLLPMMGLGNVKAIIVGCAVFGLNSGAYVSEIMRSGIKSVEIGQMEAGRAVGLGFGTVMIKIVIPQAIKNIVPTLGNEFITLIKETSVVSFITVADLYTVLIDQIGNNIYENMVPSIVLALIYIVLVAFITLLIRCIEKFFAKSDRNFTSSKRKKKKQTAEV